jgi:hypothetical protein
MVTTRGERQITWSQGQMIPPEAALAFQLIAAEQAATHLPVVITHDCDLAAAVEKEPHAEILVAHPTAKLGAAANAKVARRLELLLHSRSGPQVIELLASQKRTVPKAALFEYAPRQDVWLAPQDRLILQRWLAARYRRAAFPEAFETRLRTKVGRRTLVEHIEAILDEGGEWIRCLLFDLDEGEMTERERPDDAYRLGITVLYASALDEPKAYAAATAAARPWSRFLPAPSSGRAVRESTSICVTAIQSPTPCLPCNSASNSLSGAWSTLASRRIRHMPW